MKSYKSILALGAFTALSLQPLAALAETKTEDKIEEKRSMLSSSDQMATGRLEERLVAARAAMRKLLAGSDGNIPETILKNANCVAVFPNVLKAAFIGGAEFGRGLASCRVGANQWSRPSYMTFGAASVGWQIGANSTDLVLFFVGEKAKNTLLSSKFTLGGELEVSAGPIGKGAEASLDINRELNRVYSYANSEGIFAGASLKGGVLTPDNDSNAMVYGKDMSISSILREAPGLMASTTERGFISALPQ